MVYEPIPAAASSLGLRLRIPPEAWVSVSLECCVLSGRGPATGRSLVQSNHTECGVSECDLETSAMRRPRPTRAVEQWEKEWCMKLTFVLLKEQKMGGKRARGIARD